MLCRRFIFDPDTGAILAEAEMILGPKATEEYGAPAGTPYRETAYLQSGIVDSRPEGRHPPDRAAQRN